MSTLLTKWRDCGKVSAMGYVIPLHAPRDTTPVEYVQPALAPEQVRLGTLYPGISAGRELASHRGTSPHLTKRWVSAKRLFLTDGAAVSYPATALGYEEVGEVIGQGVMGLIVTQLARERRDGDRGGWHRAPARADA
jgi:hypothetical protein